MNKKFRFILTVFSLFIINMASEGADDGEWKVVGKSKKTIEDKINFENIQNVKEVANNILQIRSSKTQLEFGIDNITRDHSKSSHIHLKSYFTTDDRDTIKNLIIQTIDEPEDFKSYYIESRGGIKHRLALSKTFQYPIGYDEQNSEERYRLVVCFDVTGVNKLSESKRNGIFMTAFPVRKEYIMG